MIYRWRDGSRYRAKAQEVGERLEQLRTDSGGTVTPHAVVADARDEASPLHPVFEWDDSKAANAYRIDQARSVIADVMVVFAEEVDGAPREPIRAFSSLSGGNTPAYTSTMEAMQSPEMRAIVLGQARSELDSWRKRYRHYQELAAAVEKVGEALATV
jgi:hypothetical protein